MHKPAPIEIPFDNQLIQIEVNDLDHINNDDHNYNGSTAQSYVERPTFDILIVECTVNSGKNQIFVSEKNFEPVKPVINKINTTNNFSLTFHK